MKSSLLLVFLKFPTPGRVKTRLAQTVGPETAAIIYRSLVKRVLTVVSESPADEVRILFDPPEAKEAVEDWILGEWPGNRSRLSFQPQATGDLGDRLCAGFENGFGDGFQRISAIGTDSVELTPETFAQTWAWLEEADVVFGPAEDGGYYLIGLRRMVAALFHVTWSAETTLEESLQQAKQAGMATKLLSVSTDVDTIEEWKALQARILKEQFSAAMDTPIVFQPIYQQKVWGGRTLESRFGRKLPDAEAPYGESWELVDREEAQSVVRDGPLAGFTLQDLWQDRRAEVFGAGLPDGARFPLLLKILDARDDLSIQVHPPASVADELGGEPKTEMWYIAHAEPGAKLYVGLKEGISRDAFEQGIRQGTTADQVHAMEVKAGDFLFIPSGRLHAIGAGLLIYEIQQNSDTTYRVFDWNRAGLDGSPRSLHIEPSMKSIDFMDIEPGPDQPNGEILVECEHFLVECWDLAANTTRSAAGQGQCAIITVVDGPVTCGEQTFEPGDFFLIPASATTSLALKAGAEGARVLRTTIPAREVNKAVEIEGQFEMPEDLPTEAEQQDFYQKLRKRMVNWAESRSKRGKIVDYLLAGPDLFHLLCRLAADRSIPVGMKAELGVAIAYFISPIDLLPEAIIGPIGYLDDIALATWIIQILVRRISPELAQRHWAGDGDVLELVRRVLATVEELIGSGLWERVKAVVKDVK